MSDENQAASPAKSRKTGSQHALPLLVLGLALGVIGFFLAFYGEDGSADTPVATTTIVPEQSGALPEGLKTQQPPLQLKFASAGVAGKYKLSISQSTIPKAEGGVALDTRMTMTVVDEAAPLGMGGDVEIHRQYEDVVIEVLQEGKPAAANIPPQVAIQLESAKHHIVIGKTGRVKSFKLVSSPSAQLRQFMGILNDANGFIVPRFPIGAVNVGEPWSYASPYALEAEGELMVRGKYAMTNHFRGTLEEAGVEVAVVDQDLMGEASGTWGAEKKPVKILGAGRGRFWMDPKANKLVKGEVEFDQATSGGEGVGVQSTTVLRWEAVAP